MSQIKLNYCVQCKQIDKENIYNCRWLNLNFCCLLCLQRFFDRIALKCDICNKQLNYNRIHLRDDLKTNPLFTFVCDECFLQRNPLAVKCYCCENTCYKGFGTFDLKTSGLISKYVCSDECRILSLTKHGERKKIKLASCSECDIWGPCAQTIENGKFRLICSVKCLDTIEKNLTTKFETCSYCSLKFANDCQNQHVICECGIRKGFCTELCMQSHFRENSKIVICCICRHRIGFYESIRRLCDDRSFCSLKCSIAAETSIEQLMRNDERCHLEYLNLKCETCNPELEFDDSTEDCVLFDKLASTASDQVSEREQSTATMNGRSDNDEMVILNQFKAYDDDIDKLKIAPKLREYDQIVQCGHCQRCIKPTQSFMQWECLEFCNSTCYELFMYNEYFKCVSCGKISSPCIGPNVRMIGNRTYYFCGDACQKTFFDLMKFCRFCRSVISRINHSDGFCQPDCRYRHKQLYEYRCEDHTKPCHLCQSIKPTDICLRIDGVIYEFCCFVCYFHSKTSCGIFADQCTICQLYFAQSVNEDSFLLRHNNKLNTFCSQSCQSHYVYKYQSLEMCSVCSRPKSNFNMLKSNADDVSMCQVNYCSMQCLQDVKQSTELRKAYLDSSSHQNETSHHYY